jgi:ParB/RepB/Spo0J family partition protein
MPPRLLDFSAGALPTAGQVSPAAKRAVVAEAERALRALKVAWLPLAQLEPARQTLNSRRADDDAGLNELAASIQAHGLLQPVLVVAEGDRYRVVCGERRRRRASLRAGLHEMPCVVKARADERTVLLWNIVENIRRVDLSPKEKVAAIRQLAATGYGVREITRGTGIAPGTSSRWLRIAGQPGLAQALEQERLDIARAMTLAPVKDPEALDRLLHVAAETPRPELERQVQGVLQQNTYCPDGGRLADIDRKLALVRAVTPVGHAHLLRIRERVEALLRQMATDGLAADMAAAEAPGRSDGS